MLSPFLWLPPLSLPPPPPSPLFYDRRRAINFEESCKLRPRGLRSTLTRIDKTGGEKGGGGGGNLEYISLSCFCRAVLYKPRDLSLRRSRLFWERMRSDSSSITEWLPPLEGKQNRTRTILVGQSTLTTTKKKREKRQPSQCGEQIAINASDLHRKTISNESRNKSKLQHNNIAAFQGKSDSERSELFPKHIMDRNSTITSYRRLYHTLFLSQGRHTHKEIQVFCTATPKEALTPHKHVKHQSSFQNLTSTMTTASTPARRARKRHR